MTTGGRPVERASLAIETPTTNERVVIESVKPEIECGRFPIKRVVGDEVVVEADIFTDGHDEIAALLLYRHEDESDWREAALSFVDNDGWRGSFTVERIGRYAYTLRAWVDHFASWRRDLAKKREAGQDVEVDTRVGAALLEEAAERAPPPDSSALREGSGAPDLWENEALAGLAARHPDAASVTTYERELGVVVDPERAGFSAWYEMFPRSWSMQRGRHGTFGDLEQRIPYVQEMGFNVIYLPPIHPIGTSFRKGKNNAVEASGDDTGSPWAIGSDAGGHKAVNPDLGTLEDFRSFVAAAAARGIQVALDIAFQCSPDHPYVRDHPDWFRWRPDGTVQYAENPPKKYQDIYPFNFETASWRELWDELKSVFTFWIAQGVTIFRVDNPHTKPFRFWEWLIAEVKAGHPEVLFLSEAFTRPKVMYQLGKLGFSQSYTYFTWRNEKWEFEQYFEELTQTEVREFFRPNLWPNTPDILPVHLQVGGRPAFALRLLLAATLGANFGVYGPAFELLEHRPLHAGSEEYLDSEKYQLREWDLDGPDSLRPMIGRLNEVRSRNAALQSDRGLRFHPVDNDWIMCYSKTSPGERNVILVVANLDYRSAQAGHVTLSPEHLGLAPGAGCVLHDLLTGEVYQWSGDQGYVELDPASRPGHLFRVEPRGSS
ncbi:MAG: DUF3416 domain-containing protein [Dehalococcoidia bacterium]|nr:DUF3416 domain-containing protein [Dehalococcoidia bacterium]